MNLQQKISRDINLKKTGHSFKVLIDRIEGNTGIGRTQYDSPEIDNEVIIEKLPDVIKTGEFVQVNITGAGEYDLTGTVSHVPGIKDGVS
jgi:ribosomal protein S12 methylthiotransferase